MYRDLLRKTKYFGNFVFGYIKSDVKIDLLYILRGKFRVLFPVIHLIMEITESHYETMKSIRLRTLEKFKSLSVDPRNMTSWIGVYSKEE